MDEAVETDLSSCGTASSARVGLSVGGGDASRSYIALDVSTGISPVGEESGRARGGVGVRSWLTCGSDAGRDMTVELATGFAGDSSPSSKESSDSGSSPRNCRVSGWKGSVVVRDDDSEDDCGTLLDESGSMFMSPSRTLFDDRTNEHTVPTNRTRAKMDTRCCRGKDPPI